MAMEGSWDIGCGVYSWSIVVPPPPPPPQPTKTPLALGPQSCYQETNFPGHPEVWGTDVSMLSIFACGALPNTMGPNTPKWQQSYNGRGNNENLNFEVEWKVGCVTDVDTQNPQQPLGPQPNNLNICYMLFFQNWQNCEHDSL